MLGSKFVTICAIFGFFYSGFASALGLGEITLKSSSNEPLVAEIGLSVTRELTETDIFVSLASKESFKEAGVDRIFFLTNLRFKVDLDDPENPHIKVSTQEPVNEPYLNFLIDMQWPSGRKIKKFTLFLDLPTKGKS